jgi:outer membrane protein OmpU
MYKLLMGTAAAALLVSPAVAGPMGITVGGYYNAVVYSQDVDASAKRDLGIHNDTEIVFKGKGKTKNGLTIGFEIQLEGEGAADTTGDTADGSASTKSVDFIDENYVYIRGDFGKVEIGAENNAAYKQQVTAPRFLGWKTFDNNFATWGKASNFDKPLMDGIDGDALKINYYSPKINGFQFSYSLTPDASDKSGDTGLYSDSGSGSASAYGLKYSGNISGMKVQASYGLNELDEDTGQDTKEDTAIGLSVSSGAVTVGGTMTTFERDGDETDILHYGIAYKLSKETQVGLMLHAQEAANGDETNITVLGGSTKLGAGTKLTYSYETVEDDADGDSTFMGVGLLLKF